MATQTSPADAKTSAVPSQGLATQGLHPTGQVHWNLSSPVLFEAAIRRAEGILADMGPFVANTAPHTGRSPNDKFVVRESATEGDVDWGKVNHPLLPEKFDGIFNRMTQHTSGRAR